MCIYICACSVHCLHVCLDILSDLPLEYQENYRNVAALKAAFPGRYDDSGAEVRTAGEQAGFQIGFLGVTLVFAIVSGLLTGAPPSTVLLAATSILFSTNGHSIAVQVQLPSSQLLQRSNCLVTRTNGR